MASFNSAVIARVAAALYDYQLGQSSMDRLVDQVNQNGGTPAALAALVQSVYNSDFAPLGATAHEQVAAIIVKNVGITGAMAAEVEAYVAGVLDTAGAGNEGAAIIEMLNGLAGLTADPTWGPYATAFNTQITAAINYAAVQDTPDVVVHPPATVTVHQIFNLTSVDAAGAQAMRLTGGQDVRIDFTNPANQIRGLDLDGDGTIETNGLENVSSNFPAEDRGANFEIVDAYARNPLNHHDSANNFLGDIKFDGTGFAGNGVDTDGNIFLGGLGIDVAFGGVGNDFLAAGGIDYRRTGTEEMRGGRNADFFFAEFSGIDRTEGGPTLFIDGGSTADAAPPGSAIDTNEDQDWLLFEASDDDEPVHIVLDEQAGADGQNDGEEDVVSRSGETMDIDDIENFDASGNLYGFLDDMDVQIGGRSIDDRDDGRTANANYGLGSSAQLIIEGSEANNIIVAGYDNDEIDGNDGNDLLMGGNLQQLLDTVTGGVTNVNLAGITLDGIDEIDGGDGNDSILFEADTGSIDGGADTDTLWLTRYTLGTADADEVTTDGRLRLDLGAQVDAADADADGEPGFAGYGGADASTTADQTNYSSNDFEVGRVDVEGMESIDATGLGGIDYLASGSNDPELNFNNQQNFWGYNGDLDLRGTQAAGNTGSNGLYAGAGNDVLEGRGGDDVLMGGAGNDDFYFSIDGDAGPDGTDGDDVDVIRRKIDANGDGLWDTASGANVWGQDFGVDESTEVGDSVLRIVIQKVGGNGAGEDLNDVVNSVERITTGVLVNGVFEEVVLESDAISDAETYEELVAAINAAIAGSDFAGEVVAELQDDGVTIFISDTLGRTLADTDAQVDGAGVLVNQKANTQTENEFEFGAPEEIVSLDRLIYKAYEDRSDNEGVDDDAVTGSTISLGTDAYAEDLVVSFGADGTRLAEDQQYDVVFRNLTTEDTVTLNVNGVTYMLKVGVAVNGTLVENEDDVNEDQADIQDNFLTRFADFINSFMDDDTAAGQVAAAYDAGTDTLTLTQVDYNGEETVFMTTPTVSINNGSGGERATATVSNNSSHEVLLYQFDGRDNNLNSTNVLFWGQEQVSRSILETVADAGGELIGSEAVVIDGGNGANDDDLAGIAHNLAVHEDILADAENFAVHGDDYLIGGDGDDDIQGRTGDDRIRGSLGNDELDGGKDWYAILREGDDEYSVEYLNAYEAQELDADGDVLEIVLIEQTEDDATIDGGTEFDPYFDDTLIYHQADFTAGVSRFTVTLDNYEGTGEDIAFANGGAGTVGVDADGNGTVEAENVSNFSNFENIRTVSGTGLAVAGANGGQGRDTLNVMALSDDADVGVKYDLTGDATAGDVYLREDLDDNDTAETERQIIKVDGVENVIFGDGDDVLDIDETEAAKDNDITGDLGTDVVVYENDFGTAVAGEDEPTVTINVGSAHSTTTDAGVDTVVMTEGRVGSVIATDTLRGIEEITLDGETAQGVREDDTLNVEALAAGATVNYVNGNIYSDTDGDLDFADGVLQLTVNNLFEVEHVVADGDDNVVVADAGVMSGNSTTDALVDVADLTINSFLNYDLVDLRDEDEPQRLTITELRAIAGGTADTADEDDIPEAVNFAQFNFSLGQDSDVVDYSNAADDIAVVVDFNTEDDKQYVMVDGGADNNFATLDNSVEDRVDVLNDVESIVASQGESVLDLTNSTQALAVTFSREITVVGGKDVHRVQLSNLNTDAVIGKNFLEFRDNNVADASADIFAVWNRVEGSDNNEKVELTDAETDYDHEFNLRGGDNEVNYNELTRSIELTLDVVAYNEAAPSTTGRIEGDVTFFDGSGNQAGDIIGGNDTITSHSAQNLLAAGSLRVEASQDAEDVIGFAADLDDKIFVLGEVVSGSDQITVTIGAGAEANSIVLTGFEFLRDSAENDVYTMDDLERVQDNLALIDSATNDRDTVKVGDDAVAYDGGPAALTAAADTISLEVLNDVFGFDFDVLDITMVEESDLLLVGDDDDQDNDATLNAADTDYIGPGDADEDGANDTAREITSDSVVVGDLDLIDSITVFDQVWFTDASLDDETSFVLDTTNDELENGDGDVLLDTDNDLDTLNFSMVTEAVTVEIGGTAAMTIIGGAGDDTLTGGGGADRLEGGAGDDNLDGGSTSEVRTIQLAGILDATVDAAAVTLTMGTGGLVLTINESAAPADVDATDEDLDILAGAGSDAVGAALESLIMANLADINAVADAFENAAGDDIDLISADYDSGTDLLTLTFANGDDVDVTDLILGAENDTGASFAISADTTVTEGSDGGSDSFHYVAAADGNDDITGFTSTDDLITFEFEAGADGADLGDLIDDGDNNAIAFQSATDADAAAAEAAVAGNEAFFIDSANNGTFTAASLTNLTTVAALFEANFSGLGVAATEDALLVLESDTEGTFGVYFWDSSDTDGVIEASELTLIAVVTGDDVATGDFGLGDFDI